MTAPAPAPTLARRIVSVSMSSLVAVVVLGVASEVYFRARYGASYVPDPAIRADPVLGWDTTPPVAPLPLNDRHGDTVLFLGDSFTDRKQWPAEAQRTLAAQGIRIDGYNLGVTGYGTGQEFLKLRQHIGGLAPRAVVVLFFAWNDLRDNYAYPELFYGPQRASRPYLTFSNGTLSVSPIRWSSALGASFLGSELYSRVVNRARLRFDKEIVRRWPDLPLTIGWRAQIYYEDPVSWHPFYLASRAQSAYVTGAYDATIGAFKAMRDLAGKSGSSLLVIGIDNAFTVDQAVADVYIKPSADLDTGLPLTRMARLLAEENIPFINAQPALEALGEQTGDVVYNGPAGGLGIAGHLQPKADQLIGRIAARWLADEVKRQ
jgi:hypothetical protein